MKLNTVTVQTNEYDGMGRRVRKSTAAGTRNYYYDGADPILETDAAGNPLIAYLAGNVIEVTGTTRYVPLYDMRGSIVALMDAAGTIVAEYEYDAYGTILSNSNPTIALTHFYTGSEWDEQIGLYHMGARYYDPQAGRFITPDPISVAGGTNVYRYCGDDPVNLIDPSGLVDWISPTAGQGVAVHSYIEADLEGRFHRGESEFYVPGPMRGFPFHLIGSRRIDFVLEIGMHQYEAYEIKPISKINGFEGDQQLSYNIGRANRYFANPHRSADRSLTGSTFGAGSSILDAVNGSVLENRLIPDTFGPYGFRIVDIVMVTDPRRHPGMIYYKLRYEQELTEELYEQVMVGAVTIAVGAAGVPEALPTPVPAH